MSDARQVKTRAATKTTGNKRTSGKGPGRPPKADSQGGARRSQALERKSGKHSRPAKSDQQVADEIYAILFVAVGIFFAVAMHTGAAGEMGEWLKRGLTGFFGTVAYALSYCLIAYGVLVFLKKAAHISGRTLGLFTALILSLATINSARFLAQINWDTFAFSVDFIRESFEKGASLKSGGAVGMLIGMGLRRLLGAAGLYIVCFSIGLIGILALSNTPIFRYLDAMKEKRAQKRLLREAQWEEAEAEEAHRQRHYTARHADEDDPEQAAQTARYLRKKQILELVADDDLFKEGQTSEEHMKEVESKFNAAVSRKESKGRDTRGFSLGNATKAFIFGKKPHIIKEEIPTGPMGLEDPEPYIEARFEETSHAAGMPEQTPPEQAAIDAYQTSARYEQRAESGLHAALDATLAEPDMLEEASGRPLADSAAPQAEPAAVPAEAALQPAAALPAAGAASAGAAGSALADALSLAAAGGDVEAQPPKPYVLPPLSLLNKPKAGVKNDTFELNAKAALLEKTLQDFGVNARILNVSKGPTVTRYEIQPSTGVKVSSIVRLSDDIALNLEAKSIRMEAPIPGKAAVGIEIENEKVQPVMIREVIDSPAFKNHPSKISFAVGKDILGNAIIGDMADMPHMLIAGSTGSGKSVCVNSIISSFLYKAKPDEVKLVLIDPKVVELSVYNGIPHLLVPVVTDPNKAAAALNWAVQEMDDRYRKFAECSVRKLFDYNKKATAAGEASMPQIVIVIDELADLMMAASNAVETAICRLAQKARAAGMHLIVATQRPSVDVITGVIKANIPSRVAFAVSSQIDSRTILDMSGAEKLVGKGDMLFNPLGKAKPVRVQGTYIADGEVEAIIEHVKAQAGETQQSYSSDLIQVIETSKISLGADENTDELLADAIEFVVNAEQASVSMLQRRFRIGYNRAARLVDMMEERGIVGPADGSRPRSVLVSGGEYESLEAGSAEAAENA